jgi:capsular polysaccharide export protein
LGHAIFNLQGLTFQGPLDRFWRKGRAPSADLYKAFKRVVIQKAQVNGSFFTNEGLELAVNGTLQRMNVETLPKTAAHPKARAPAPAFGKAPIALSR